ncbi:MULTISPECIES: hypothetical protein [unclassified Streptomyces]|uniref:hypothetical protein n=1 Tax=unclassified Streptomyces TaxID=2593676 RepID=UPI00095E9E46|nr:hypothetical protein [Streptomyces sp. TSRI0281]OKI40533.1 hypothetical protein A6A29_39120 [Streptomyces sp. TSRI0281]
MPCTQESRILADSYGLDTPERGNLVDAILDRQNRNALWWHHRLTAPDRRVADSEQILARIAWSRREHEHTAANRAVFANALR